MGDRTCVNCVKRPRTRRGRRQLTSSRPVKGLCKECSVTVGRAYEAPMIIGALAKLGDLEGSIRGWKATTSSARHRGSREYAKSLLANVALLRPSLRTSREERSRAWSWHAQPTGSCWLGACYHARISLSRTVCPLVYPYGKVIFGVSVLCPS